MCKHINIVYLQGQRKQLRIGQAKEEGEVFNSQPLVCGAHSACVACSFQGVWACPQKVLKNRHQEIELGGILVTKKLACSSIIIPSCLALVMNMLVGKITTLLQDTCTLGIGYLY